MLVSVLGTGCEVFAPVEPPPARPSDPGFVVSRPFPDIRSLNDVAVLAFDASHITRAYAVGTDGTVLSYDGATWTDESPGLPDDLESVSGVIDADGVETLLAVGADGVVLQRVDGVWTVLPSPEAVHLFGVWVHNATDAFVVGDQGAVWRFDGVSLVALTREILIDTGTIIDLPKDDPPAVDGDGQVDACVVAADCRPVPLAGAPPPGADGVECFGQRCRVAFPISDALKSVMGNDADDVWTVGPRGVVYHFDGDTFRPEDSQTNRPLADIFTRGGIWAATTDGVLLRRRDGDNGWTDNCNESDTAPENCPFLAPSPVFLQGIWARGDGDVFAVGLSENLFHFQDGGWTLSFIEEQSEMRAIDGATLPRPADAPAEFLTVREVIAVGAGGRIVRGPTVRPQAGETPIQTRAADTPEKD